MLKQSPDATNAKFQNGNKNANPTYRKMKSFKQLFDVMEREFSPLEFNKNYYRKAAESIALEMKSRWIVIAIFILAIGFSTFFFEELRIGRYQHIIARHRQELSMPHKDSVVYKCRHCLQDHSLRLLQDSTINPFIEER